MADPHAAISPSTTSKIQRQDGLQFHSIPRQPCLTRLQLSLLQEPRQELGGGAAGGGGGGGGGGGEVEAVQEGLMLSDLPQELVERIRACLPFSAYFRSSLVCKGWKDSAFSPHMLSLCAESHPAEPWLLALPVKHCRSCCYAFDPVFNKWRRMPPLFLPKDSVYPLAAAGGLLCLSTYTDLSIVCPLTGTSKVLPKWQEDRIDPVIGLVVEDNIRNYKVIAVGSYETAAATEVYDSSTNLWTVTGCLPPDTKMSFHSCVFSKGLFYCLTAEPPDTLLVYDLETGVWNRLPVMMPSSFAYGMLVEHKGRLLLIGISQGGEPFRSIRIWEFAKPGKEMNELERMPYGMFKGFWGRGKGSVSMQFVSSGHLLYFYSSRSPRLILCDLTRKPVHWQWLPATPADVDWGEIHLLNFCIHPVLNSSLGSQES